MDGQPVGEVVVEVLRRRGDVHLVEERVVLRLVHVVEDRLRRRDEGRGRRRRRLLAHHHVERAAAGVGDAVVLAGRFGPVRVARARRVVADADVDPAVVAVELVEGPQRLPRLVVVHLHGAEGADTDAARVAEVALGAIGVRHVVRVAAAVVLVPELDVAAREVRARLDAVHVGGHVEVRDERAVEGVRVSPPRTRHGDLRDVVDPGVEARPHPVRLEGVAVVELQEVRHAVERRRIVAPRHGVGDDAVPESLHGDVERVDEVVSLAQGGGHVLDHRRRQVGPLHGARLGRGHRVRARRVVAQARRRHGDRVRHRLRELHHDARGIGRVEVRVRRRRAVHLQAGQEVLSRPERLRERQHELRAGHPRGGGEELGRRGFLRVVQHVHLEAHRAVHEGVPRLVDLRPVGVAALRVRAHAHLHPAAALEVVQAEDHVAGLVVVDLHRAVGGVEVRGRRVVEVESAKRVRQVHLLPPAIRHRPEFDVALVHQLAVAVDERRAVAPDAQVRHLLLEPLARAVRRHADRARIVREGVERHPHPVVLPVVHADGLEPVGDAREAALRHALRVVDGVGDRLHVPALVGQVRRHVQVVDKTVLVQFGCGNVVFRTGYDHPRGREGKRAARGRLPVVGRPHAAHGEREAQAAVVARIVERRDLAVGEDGRRPERRAAHHVVRRRRQVVGDD